MYFYFGVNQIDLTNKCFPRQSSKMSSSDTQYLKLLSFASYDSKLQFLGNCTINIHLSIVLLIFTEPRLAILYH